MAKTLKPARLSVRLTESDKAQFVRLCESHGIDPSLIVRELIRAFTSGEIKKSTLPLFSKGTTR